MEELRQAFKDNAGPKDWPEDFDHENGMYTNHCVYCKSNFIGYKRRVICKECDTKARQLKAERPA